MRKQDIEQYRKIKFNIMIIYMFVVGIIYFMSGLIALSLFMILYRGGIFYGIIVSVAFSTWLSMLIHMFISDWYNRSIEQLKEHFKIK